MICLVIYPPISAIALIISGPLWACWNVLNMKGYGVTCFNVLERSRTSWKMLGGQERTGCAGTFCICWNALYVLDRAGSAETCAACWYVLDVLGRFERARRYWNVLGRSGCAVTCWNMLDYSGRSGMCTSFSMANDYRGLKHASLLKQAQVRSLSFLIGAYT